jgi:hypothetical protein
MMGPAKRLGQALVHCWAMEPQASSAGTCSPCFRCGSEHLTGYGVGAQKAEGKQTAEASKKRKAEEVATPSKKAATQ